VPIALSPVNAGAINIGDADLQSHGREARGSRKANPTHRFHYYGDAAFAQRSMLAHIDRPPCCQDPLNQLYP
jgi:hypothetical protein